MFTFPACRQPTGGAPPPAAIDRLKRLAGAEPLEAAALVRSGIQQAVASLQVIEPDGWQVEGTTPMIFAPPYTRHERSVLADLQLRLGSSFLDPGQDPGQVGQPKSSAQDAGVGARRTTVAVDAEPLAGQIYRRTRQLLLRHFNPAV